MCDVCCYFKQKTSYELRISDWSSDVCSSDLVVEQSPLFDRGGVRRAREGRDHRLADRTHNGARYLAKSRGEINDSDAFESPEMIGDQAQDGFGQKLHRAETDCFRPEAGELQDHMAIEKAKGDVTHHAQTKHGNHEDDDIHRQQTG